MEANRPQSRKRSKNESGVSQEKSKMLKKTETKNNERLLKMSRANPNVSVAHTLKSNTQRFVNRTKWAVSLVRTW